MTDIPTELLYLTAIDQSSQTVREVHTSVNEQTRDDDTCQKTKHKAHNSPHIFDLFHSAAVA
jgi:hypothetical protein